MSSAIIPFTSGEWSIRAIDIDGQPYFLLADVRNALKLNNNNSVVARIRKDKGVVKHHPLQTAGGTQQAVWISEAGLYKLAFQSKVPAAEAFTDWVTHEVLPTLRATGQYVAPQTREQRLALAFTEAMDVIAEQRTELTVARPKAAIFDKIASGKGSWSVQQAAQLLAQAGARTGQRRLFNELTDRAWIFRDKDGLHPKQWALERHLLTVKAHNPVVKADGTLWNPTPQVRVTATGLTRLLELHGLAEPLVAIEAAA